MAVVSTSTSRSRVLNGKVVVCVALSTTWETVKHQRYTRYTHSWCCIRWLQSAPSVSVLAFVAVRIEAALLGEAFLVFEAWFLGCRQATFAVRPRCGHTVARFAGKALGCLPLKS